MKKKVTLSVDSKTYSDFQKYCEKNAIIVSKKIELFIRKFMKNKKNLSVFFMLFGIIFLFSFVFAASFVSADTPSITTPEDDAYVRGDLANTNYGSETDLHVKWVTSKRNTYLKFNISSIPDNQIIDNASLCLYLYHDQGSQIISVYHVYEDWDEDSVTWNNQPCGGNDPLDNSSACNLTAEDSIATDTTKSNSWLCWSVKEMVSKDYSSQEQISMILHTGDVGDADMFYSKEYPTNTSLRPYLNITYHPLDIINPDVSIVYPTNTSFNINVSELNYTVSDANLQNCWYSLDQGATNTTITCGQNVTGLTSNEGSNTWTIYANDINGNENLSTINFFKDTVNPTLIVTNPQNSTYGINTSLPMNFSVSDSGSGIDSCWYNIDGGINNSIASCQNTTFDVIGDENHTLNLFVNDSLGNLASESVTFTIITTVPILSLIYPEDNSFISYGGDVYVNYSVFSGIGVSTCQLWSDFNGSWSLNQIEINPPNGDNYFLSNLTNDRVYNWGIVCNDTQNRIRSLNYSFTLDTVNPSLSLSEPTGTKSSRTGILLSSTASDSSPISCLYNVYRGASIEISNTSINCTGSTTFDVTVDADFTLNFYVNDSADNKNSSNSSFTVSSGGSSSSSSSGGGGSGGGIITKPVISGTNKIEFSSVPLLIIKAGESKKSTLKARNAGTNFLNDCRLRGTGTHSNWISYNNIKDLAAGEEHEFSFDVNTPEDIEAGSYSIGVILECIETNKSTSISVEIIEEKLGFELIKVEREGENQVKVRYYLEELSGVDQDVELQFLLFDSNNEKITEVLDNKKILASSKEEFEVLIDVDQSIEGELSLLVNLNSETYSSFVQEDVILGSVITGLAVFEDIGGTQGLMSIGFIVLFLGFTFFMVRRILKHKKKIKKTRKKHLLWLD